MGCILANLVGVCTVTPSVIGGAENDSRKRSDTRSEKIGLNNRLLSSLFLLKQVSGVLDSLSVSNPDDS